MSSQREHFGVLTEQGQQLFDTELPFRLHSVKERVTDLCSARYPGAPRVLRECRVPRFSVFRCSPALCYLMNW